ncbi:cell division protein SepF [Candidatus Woesearchaeota archaeon]|nr:cell division protein SepF [Candidatus Woesearchaeota archaeon]
MGLFSNIKSKIVTGGNDYFDEVNEDYLEIDMEEGKKRKDKIKIKTFLIREFDDLKFVLDDLREGYTIALLNVRPIKERDIVELKRTINKLKKTCEAIEGDIAGFGDDWIVATPSFAFVHREEAKKPGASKDAEQNF